eukprot:64122_1
MTTLQQIKWTRLRNMNDDIISAVQTNDSIAILCCKSIKYFNNRTKTWTDLSFNSNTDETWSISRSCRTKTTFDYKNKRMYIYQLRKQKIHILDLELKTAITFSLPHRDIVNVMDDECVIANNEFHIIGDNGHHVFNKSSVTLDIKTKSELLKKVHYHTLVYLCSQKIIFLIAEDIILSYCTKTNIWSQLSIPLPNVLRLVSVVVTRDDKYIILLGGTARGSMCDSIYVLDVEKVKLFECSIKCPVSNVVQTAILNDYKMEELISFGFVRDNWKNKQYKNILFPPFYLIKLIQSYYWKDEIHLFWTMFHWKIRIDDVLNNIIPFDEESYHEQVYEESFSHMLPFTIHCVYS